MTTSQQARADTRECSACGGTGCEKRIDHWHASYRYGECRERCIVCLGAGRISDRMSVADALADAETLRQLAGDIVAEGLRRYATSAQRNALGIANLIIFAGSGADAYSQARAAFRAVPELRSE